MRVLMTVDAVGGVWTYAMELTRALGRRGVQVTLAVMGPPPSREQQLEVGRLPNADLRIGPFRLEWMEDAWGDVRDAGTWLLDLEARVQPDVVHVNGFAHGNLPWRAPVLLVGHSCVISWWKAVHDTPAPREWARYRREVRQGFRGADLVVAPTGSMLRALRAHHGPLGRAAVIPNARDPAAFRPGRKSPFVFTTGRLWDKAKNVAAVDAVAGGLPWPVLVAGDATDPKGDAIPPTQAAFMGRVPGDALPDYYARAAVFALPARYEPFGLSALEAAHAGCALVLGNIPSLREVWGNAAFYVNPEDRRGLRDVLRHLTEDTALRRAYGARARARAARYTPDVMAAQYLDAYHRISRSRPSGLKAAREEDKPCAS